MLHKVLKNITKKTFGALSMLGVSSLMYYFYGRDVDPKTIKFER